MNPPLWIKTFLAVCMGSVLFPAAAADRMRPGQWTGTTVTGGKTFPNSSCITQADADAMNGDAKAVQGYLEKIIPPEVCKISSVKVDGGTVVYSASCAGQPPRVITTAFHGTSSEANDSSGTKSEAKLVGPCK